ncbi:hypothetical protein MTQ10_08105 [Streptomyces sp. XM83C]|jgi:hypothetical protein|uniref:Uncharacterized protein n=1 Tax=Streptomyces thermocoprophilus TaxID=78356 RepID=A0ABV5V9H4_9ACTN|nr:hypothetical protein [Streptomyces sp. XM83C]MCK1819570.1 hypothetical protein [Streptomyces sp. XM83C]
MDESDHSFLRLSGRELNSLCFAVLRAKSKEQVRQILRTFELSDADFVGSFPDLAKHVLLLPD